MVYLVYGTPVSGCFRRTAGRYVTPAYSPFGQYAGCKNGLGLSHVTVRGLWVEY